MILGNGVEDILLDVELDVDVVEVMHEQALEMLVG